MNQVEAYAKKIGKQINENRKKSSFTVESLGEELRINPEFIEKIEKGDLNFLPMPYVRAFIKTIAKEVGLDGELILSEWPEEQSEPDDETPEKPQEKAATSTSKAEKQKEPTLPIELNKYSKEIILGVSVVAVILIALLINLNRSENAQQAENSPEINETEQPISFDEVLKEVSEKENPLEEITAQREQLPEPDREPLDLQIEAIDSVWVQIIIDDEAPSEAIFIPGLTRTFTADQDFKLQIGNAGGIKLYLENRDLGALGRTGQVRRIRVDQEGIHPWPRDTQNE